MRLLSLECKMHCRQNSIAHSIAGQILTLGPKFPAGRPVPTIMMAPDSGGVIDLAIGKLGVDFKM